MIVSVNILFVFISESIKVLALYFLVNLFALFSHKTSITFLIVGLSRFHCCLSWLCISFPRTSLDFHYTLCNIEKFC
jgi:hypothetical protein